eukprot:scaffold33370_cov58-Phaeocystis_antarctica.AAC.4
MAGGWQVAGRQQVVSDKCQVANGKWPVAGGWWLVVGGCQVAGRQQVAGKWRQHEGITARLRRREHRWLGRGEDGAAREARRRRRRGAAGRSGFLGGEEGAGARTRRPGRLQALQVEPGVCQPGVPGVMCGGSHHRLQSGARCL